MAVFEDWLSYLVIAFYFGVLVPFLLCHHIRRARLTPEERKKEDKEFEREQDL